MLNRDRVRHLFRNGTSMPIVLTTIGKLETSLAGLAVFMNGNFRPTGTQRKTPGSCLPGVLLSVSSLSGSEVTLSANVQEHRALVLVLVERGRLGRRTCQDASTRELLVRALQRCRLTSRSVYLPTAVSCSACTRMWNTLSPRRLTWVSPQ